MGLPNAPSLYCRPESGRPCHLHLSQLSGKGPVNQEWQEGNKDTVMKDIRHAEVLM